MQLRTSLLLVLVGSFGCGRVGFQAHTRGSDVDGGATLDGASSPDGGNDAGPPPWPTTPFGAPVQIGVVGSPGEEEDPSMTADGMELYFTTSRSGQDEIWVSRRVGDAWGAPTPVDEVNLGAGTHDPSVSPDGLTLWTSRFGTEGGQDVWVSTRPDRSSAWSTPVVVVELSSSSNDTATSVHLGGLGMIVTSSRGGGAGGWDLWASMRASLGATWGAPTPISELNTGSGDENAMISPDGLVIYFVSNRPGGEGMEDIMVATRSSPTEAFGAPVYQAELNTGAFESDPWVSYDGRTILFSSDRGGDKELYEATR